MILLLRLRQGEMIQMSGDDKMPVDCVGVTLISASETVAGANNLLESWPAR